MTEEAGAHEAGAHCVVCDRSCGCYGVGRGEQDCPFPIVAHFYDWGICAACDSDWARTLYLRCLDEARARRREY